AITDGLRRESLQMTDDVFVGNLAGQNAVRLPLGVLPEPAVDSLRTRHSLKKTSCGVGLFFGDLQWRQSSRAHDVAVAVVSAKQNGMIRRNPVEREACDLRIQHDVMPDGAEDPGSRRNLLDRLFQRRARLLPTRLHRPKLQTEALRIRHEVKMGVVETGN